MNDLRYALRTFARRPGFTAIAILTLAIGIGANTAIFSVVNAVLLRPLPFRDSHELVRVFALRGTERWTASPPDYVDWREANAVFEQMAAFYPTDYALTGLAGGATRLSGAVVSASLFPLLGVEPALGSGFTVEHETIGHDRVVFLSDALWRTRFGADRGVLGRSIVLDGEAFTVLGVMPPTFGFPSGAELWTPLAFSQDDLATQRGAHYLTVLARLGPGVAGQQAAAAMERIAAGLAEAYPRSNAGWSATVVGMREAVVENVRPALMMLLVAVGVVLLIACVNVANLLLARAVGRARELAIRTALGARRWRLIRGLIVESVVLGLVGGGAGLLLAVWGTSLLSTLEVSGIPRLDEVRIDLLVLSFTLVVSVLAGILFGILPAFQVSFIADLNRRLKGSSRGVSDDRRRGRVKQGLVVAETALALTLVIAAGLLLRSFAALTRVDPGFDADRVITFNLSLPESRYAEPHQSEAFVADLLNRLRTLPGVQAAGAVFGLPMSGFSYSISAYELDGRRLEPPEDDRLSTQVRVVTSDYFRTLGARLLRGRVITESDHAAAPPVVVLNETAARLLWPDADPLGRHFTIGTSFGLGRGRAGGTVVGIVGDMHDVGLDEPVRPQMFLSHRQFPLDFMTIAVRPTSDPALLLEPIRRVVAEMDVDVPVYAVRPLETLVGESIAEQRFYLRAVALFALVALALAAIGIYGVMAYGVSQRTGEIGVRLALGARRGEVMRLIVRQGMRVTLIGVAIGLGAAFVGTRVMAALLYGVGPTDVVTYGGAVVVLTGAAFFACWVPARRATRIDPMEALRYE